MNAPINYFGGKGMMFNNIIKYFPKPHTYDTYIEPFGCSYSIGFKMPYIPPTEIYNDLDKNVFTLYKVLNDRKLFNQFKDKCDLCVYDESTRAYCKSKLKEDLNDVDRAFYFFYVNHTSVNGIGGFSSSNLPRRNMSKSVAGLLSSIDRLTETHERLSHVLIRNTDGIKLIENYSSDNVFIYADPPYVWETRTKTRYDIDMPNDVQQMFLKACIESKAKILVSGYDNNLYDVLLEYGFCKVSFDLNVTDGSKEHEPKQVTETLWYNYDATEGKANTQLSLF